MAEAGGSLEARGRGVHPLRLAYRLWRRLSHPTQGGLLGLRPRRLLGAAGREDALDGADPEQVTDCSNLMLKAEEILCPHATTLRWPCRAVYPARRGIAWSAPAGTARASPVRGIAELGPSCRLVPVAMSPGSGPPSHRSAEVSRRRGPTQGPDRPPSRQPAACRRV